MGPLGRLARSLGLLVWLALAESCCWTPVGNNDCRSIMANKMITISLMKYASVLTIMRQYLDTHEHTIMHQVPILVNITEG